MWSGLFIINCCVMIHVVCSVYSKQLCLFSDLKPELMGNFVTKDCKTVKSKNAMWAVSLPGSSGEKNKKYQNLVWGQQQQPGSEEWGWSGVRTLASGHCLSVFFSKTRFWTAALDVWMDETYFKWNAPPLFWPCPVPLVTVLVVY